MCGISCAPTRTYSKGRSGVCRAVTKSCRFHSSRCAGQRPMDSKELPPPIIEWITDRAGEVQLLTGEPRLRIIQWAPPRPGIGAGLGWEVHDVASGMRYNIW